MDTRLVNRAVDVARRPITAVEGHLLPVLCRLSQRFSAAAGGDQRPAFYDIDQACPAFRILDRAYPVIREEMESVLSYKDRIPRYHDLDRGQGPISQGDAPDRNWRVFMLRAPVGSATANQARCPRTTALLRQIPGLFEAFFSILDAGKSIPAHNAAYHGYLRYHLGLRVPKDNPPMMRVKDQFHVWEEGRSILFDDSWNHEVYNQSRDIRVVLIADVLRPLSPGLYAANWLIARVLMRHTEEAKQFLANMKKYS